MKSSLPYSSCDLRLLAMISIRCAFDLIISPLYRHQRLTFKHNMYKLREERNMKPSTFAELVSSTLYERRYSLLLGLLLLLSRSATDTSDGNYFLAVEPGLCHL